MNHLGKILAAAALAAVPTLASAGETLGFGVGEGDENSMVRCPNDITDHVEKYPKGSIPSCMAPGGTVDFERAADGNLSDVIAYFGGDNLGSNPDGTRAQYAYSLRLTGLRFNGN